MEIGHEKGRKDAKNAGGGIRVTEGLWALIPSSAQQRAGEVCRHMRLPETELEAE
jgi:hypothetical protein